MNERVITPGFEQLLRQSPGLYAAAVDKSLRPETTRLLSATIEPDSDILRVTVADAFSQRFLRCVDEHPRVAVIATVVQTYEALQFKGRLLEKHPATAADLALIEADVAGFLDLVRHVGVDPARYRQTWVVPPYTTLRVAVDAVFDQTPRRGAGALVRATQAGANS